MTLSLLVLLLSSLTAVVALRNNYTTMVELREAVYAADAAGGDVEAPLASLREHVHAHMNTDLARGNNQIRPPIQLKGQYERLLAGEGERVKQRNAQVQAEAEVQCGAQFPGAGFNSQRVNCITEFMSANGTRELPVADSLYKFDFISPRWSPDLAGWSIVVAVVSGILSLLLVIKKLLHRLHSGVV